MLRLEQFIFTKFPFSNILIIIFTEFRMDHNNQRAFCGLVSLESSNKVNESGTFEPPMPNANPNEFQDNNFEMIEVQELIPPHGEMEGEGDTVWDNIELGGNHF